MKIVAVDLSKFGERIAWRRENKLWLNISCRLVCQLLDRLDELEMPIKKGKEEIKNLLDLTKKETTDLFRGEMDLKLSEIATIEKEYNFKFILHENE